MQEAVNLARSLYHTLKYVCQQLGTEHKFLKLPFSIRAQQACPGCTLLNIAFSLFLLFLHLIPLSFLQAGCMVTDGVISQRSGAGRLNYSGILLDYVPTTYSEVSLIFCFIHHIKLTYNRNILTEKSPKEFHPRIFHGN